MIRLIASTCLALIAPFAATAQSSAPAAAPVNAAAALPPGPGKAIAERMCKTCHGLEVVTAKRASADDWAATVQLMVSRGADGTDEEIDTLTKYLASSFPAVKDGTTAPAAAPSSAPSAAPPPSHLNSVNPRFLTQLAPSRGSHA